MAALGVFICCNCYYEMVKYDLLLTFDDTMFGYCSVIGAFCAAFCSLYLGTEYSDGTIRNKLMVGCSRSAIYLSNLFVSFSAALLMCGAYLAAVCALGLPMFGSPETEPTLLAAMLLCSIVLVLAFSALYTMISMLNQNKAVVAVISIVLFFLLLFASMLIMEKLSEPEFYDNYYFLNEAGEIVKGEPELNANYLQGIKRTVFEFLHDFLPTGQSMQLAGRSPLHLWRMPLYSLLIALTSTACGLLGFRKKDLK